MKTTKKCIYCGQFIVLNKEEIKLLQEGEISFSSFDCCEECSNNQHEEEDYFAGYDSEF